MNPRSVLIVDRKPLRSAALRAHLGRYALSSALACDHPPDHPEQPWQPQIMRGDDTRAFPLWLVVLGKDTELRDWAAISKPGQCHWVALRVPGSKLSEAELLAAHFDEVFTLPLAEPQLSALLQQQGYELQTAAPCGSDLPMLDDTSAQAAAMGDSDLVNELRTMLRDDLQQRIPQVAQELARNEVAEAAETVHRLVGGCGYCGAKALQQASLDLENALHARDVDAVDQVYGHWLAAADELLTALADKR